MVKKKATYGDYIGRLPCGCCVAVVSDSRDKATAKAVADFIKGGLTVTHVEGEALRAVFAEESFMNCPHEETVESAQLRLGV